MKKNLIIFIICCLWGSISLYAQQTSRLYGEDPAGWKYHGGDEFNEGKVDPLKWGVYGATEGGKTYMMSGHHLLSYFNPANVIFETDTTGEGEKVCRLASTKATDKKHPIWNDVVQTDWTAWYTGGLSSRDSDKKDSTFYPLYSRIEIRAKTGYENGFWPALWLRHFKKRPKPETQGSFGAGRAELDILEFFARATPIPTVRQSMHLYDAKTVNKKVCPKCRYDKEISGEKPGKGYHIYGVQIEKDPMEEGHAIITFLLDGKETNTLSTKSVTIWDPEDNFIKDAIDRKREDRVWDIALNNTVGGKQPDVGYPAEDATTHDLTIDWVRVYVPTGKAVVEERPPFLIGSAVSSIGWDIGKAEVMKKEGDTYTWTGNLEKGEFKFLLSDKEWQPAYVASSKMKIITSGSKYDLVYDIASNREDNFVIQEDGEYTIVVDLKNKTMIATKNIGGPSIGELPKYILGDAVIGVGWNNKIALKMAQPDASKAIYTWTGQLGSGHFKFITELNTWKSIIPTQRRNENVLSGYKHSVTDKWHGDYRFNVTVKGNYTVTLSMEDNTMTVVKDDAAMPIYLLGDATEAEWDNKKGIPMEQTSTGVYTRTGFIDKGYFKFISQSGTWSSILPAKSAHETLQSGVETTISNNFIGDYKFEITEKGTYSLTLNLKNKTLVATQIDKKSPIYILGNAIDGVGFNNNKALEMEQPDASKKIYTWTGILTRGQFKFITKLGTWRSIIPIQWRQNVQVSAFQYTVTDKWLGDNQFNVTVPGKHTITLNLETNTMMAELPTNMASSGIDFGERDVLIIPMQGSVSINIHSKTTVDQAELFDLHGKVVASSKNNLYSFSLGNNIAGGVYVVKLLYDGKVVTKKVIIK